jgi:hypothetical protein
MRTKLAASAICGKCQAGLGDHPLPLLDVDLAKVVCDS